MSFTDISRHIAQMWNALPEEEKEVYRAKAVVVSVLAFWVFDCIGHNRIHYSIVLERLQGCS